MPSHILIVDDEPDLAELIALTLGRMGLTTSTAGSVTEARKRLLAESFDLS